MPEMTHPYDWQGRTMFGSDGEKIGKISDIYEDPATGRPEWATVSSGLFGTRSHFVPLSGATPAGDVVRAQVTKAQVKDAPGVERDDELSEQEERRLFDHYGVAYTNEESRAAENEPAGDQRRAEPDGDGEPGRPRLRRYVVTEKVIMAVPVTREVMVEREPAGDETSDDPLHGSVASDEQWSGTDDAQPGGRRS